MVVDFVGRLERIQATHAAELHVRRLANAQHVVLHVVAGELVAGVEHDALAKVEFERLVVGGPVPAFGQQWLRIALRILRREGVEHHEH
jgi:hypothetical protein